MIPVLIATGALLVMFGLGCLIVTLAERLRWRK
jgi:hypothetical protein